MCPRCNARLFNSRYEDEVTCLNCGNLTTLTMIPPRIQSWYFCKDCRAEITIGSKSGRCLSCSAKKRKVVTA